MCDEVILDSKSAEKQSHCCKREIDSVCKVHEALLKLKAHVNEQNNKIYNIFLHNALQPNINID